MMFAKSTLRRRAILPLKSSGRAALALSVGPTGREALSAIVEPRAALFERLG